MPYDPLIAHRRARDLRRQVVVFSVLGLLVFVILVAIFEHHSATPHRSSRAVKDLLRATPWSAAAISWHQVPALAGVGFGAGLLAGMLGMGGGVLKVSGMLLLFRMDIFFARAVSLVTMLLSSASALWQYAKDGLVLWQLARPMVTMGVVGALLGALGGNQLVSSSLTHIFGFFALFLSLNTLAMVFADPNEGVMVRDFGDTLRVDQGYLCAAIGALHGGVCGLLGISGGVIATPLQQVLLRVPLRHAIANTLLASTAVTAVASVVVVYSGVSRGDFLLSDVLLVDLVMGGGAMIGARLGTYVGELCNVTVLRLSFVIITFIAGISIVF